MTYNQFKSIIRPKPGTTEGTIKSWYKWCRIGVWTSNIKSRDVKYVSSDTFIKNISMKEYKEYLKIYDYFDKLVKYKEKLEKINEDFE
jgi:hypothetical protein